MTNLEKFTEVFGTELHRQYATKTWWEQEYVPPVSEKCTSELLINTIETDMSHF